MPAKYEVGYQTVDGWACYGYSTKKMAHQEARAAARRHGHAEMIVRRDGREFDIYYDLQPNGTVKAVEM